MQRMSMKILVYSVRRRLFKRRWITSPSRWVYYKQNSLIWNSAKIQVCVRFIIKKQRDRLKIECTVWKGCKIAIYGKSGMSRRNALDRSRKMFIVQRSSILLLLPGKVNLKRNTETISNGRGMLF